MTTTITYVWDDDPSPKLRAGFRDAAATWETVLDVEFRETTGPADLTIYVSDIYGPGAADIGGPGMWLDPSLESRWGACKPSSFGRSFASPSRPSASRSGLIRTRWVPASTSIGRTARPSVV